MRNLTIVLLSSLFCYLTACSTNSNNSNDSADSSSATADTLTTINDTAKKASTPVEVKDPSEDLKFVFKDIITTMKSNESLAKLNRYINQKTGMYHIYTVGDYNTSYDKYDKLEDLNGSEANGRGPDSYMNFHNALAKIDTALFSLNYDLAVADECKLKKQGTFGILIKDKVSFLSNCYNKVLQVTGNDPDPEEVAKLKQAESMASVRVVLNVFDRSNGNGAEVFYFAKIDKKWYLLAIDLTDCGGR